MFLRKLLVLLLSFFLFGAFCLLLTFLLFGTFFGGHGRAPSSFQTGYVQGLAAGQQAITGDGAATAVAPSAPAYHPGPFSFFGFMARVSGCFLSLFLLLGLMGLLFGRRHGHRHGGKWRSRHKAWHAAGGTPPWYDKGGPDEPVMKA